jgi:hypothetical protein
MAIPGPGDHPPPLAEKAGALITLAAGVLLAWIAIDLLRPRRPQEDAPDDSGD